MSLFKLFTWRVFISDYFERVLFAVLLFGVGEFHYSRVAFRLRGGVSSE